MTTTMYGIPNCDTIKKAQKWLIDNNISFTFHDYRKEGIDLDLLTKLYQTSDWETLLNKRSTSYRALTEQQKETLSADTINALFIASPTLIKRPVVIHQGKAIVGFKAQQYQTFFTE